MSYILGNMVAFNFIFRFHISFIAEKMDWEFIYRISDLNVEICGSS